MCESNVYLVKERKEELLMESVDVLEPVGKEGYRLIDIFGVQKTIQARIKSMNLINHKILFKK